MSSPGEPHLPHAAELRWSVWPVRDEPLQTFVMLLVAGLLLYGIGQGLGSWLTAAVATGVFLASLWRMWIPISYEISPRGVAESLFDRTQRIGWRDIARIEIFPDGFLLQAIPEASPLAGLRGTFIPWGNQRDAAIALIRLYGPRVGVG